jgi:hypothetical protein
MRMGTAEIESERREEFEKWLSDLDAVLLAVGD